MFFNQEEIIYEKEGHRYFNKEKTEYTSVSRLLKSLQVPFDRETMARTMSVRISEEQDIDKESVYKELLQEWEEKREEAAEKGDYIHDQLEQFVNKGTCETEMGPVSMYLTNKFLKASYRFYPEQIIFSHKYKVAGRSDLILQRQKSKRPVIDFLDYKTNLFKGIQFDSISRKDIVRHYNKFLLPPFDYLEDCNYIIYSLQLSIYAFLAMENPNIRIGRLGILFIDRDSNCTYYPVPFMKEEAEKICELNLTRKKLDDVKKYPLTVKEAFNPNDVKDDWD